MIKKYALVLGGVVKNIVLWDEDDKSWSLPEGHAAVVASDEVGIGWTRAGGVFVAPVAPAAVVVAVPFADDKLAQLTKFRADRVLMLNAIVGMATLGGLDAPSIALLAAFRQGLLDMPKFPTVVAATDSAGLKAAMAAQYAALVAPLPMALRVSFKLALS